MGNEISLIKMKFGILVYGFNASLMLDVDVGSHLVMGLARWSLAETPWSRCVYFFYFLFFLLV